MSLRIGVLVVGIGSGTPRGVRGELPRARQIGVTGRSIATRRYLGLATSGKFNHTMGIQRAHTVVAVNSDPSAPIFTTVALEGAR